MTALDDALNASSIVFGPHQLKAYWREVDNNDIDGNPDSVSNLTDQFSGTMTVNHSLDDGLPDPVTMTTGNEASGVLSAGVNGKEGVVHYSSGVRAITPSAIRQSAAPTRFVTGSNPSPGLAGDYLLCAVLINASNVALVQTQVDPKDQWDFLGTSATVTGLALYVYGTRLSPVGHQDLMLQADSPVSWVSITQRWWGLNPAFSPLTYRVADVQMTAETSAATGHQVTSQLKGRGYQVGIWGSLSGTGPWNGTVAGSTEWGESVQNGLDLMMSTSPLRDPGSNTLQATTTASTSVAVMAAISLEPFARPRMDARQYFSTFNTDSPVHGFDRDTADVRTALRVLTTDGPVDTQVFKGQMQDIPISGRSASVEAVSKARIRMNRTVTLPVVSGEREGLTTDWLASWLMARGGSFAGSAPNIYTRGWWTMYGSVHSNWGASTDYNAVFNWQQGMTPTGRYGTKNPPVVTGPFGLPAMFAQQTVKRTDEIKIRPNGFMWTYPTDDFPHLRDNGNTGPLMIDMMSGANSKGRLTFWMRCDPVVDNPSYLSAGGVSQPGTSDRLYFAVYARDRPGNILGTVHCELPTLINNPILTWLNPAKGSNSVSASSFTIPSDGQWHFFGFWWDFAAGQYAVKIDGAHNLTASSYFFNNNFTSTADLAPTERELRATGGSVDIDFQAHLPISDILLDSGMSYDANTTWSDFYPTYKTANAVFRPTYQKMKGLAAPAAVNVWDTFADLARSTLAAYRVDENDVVNYLPLAYFGEPAQMTPTTPVQDVARNAGDLEVDSDNTKTRNVVTITYDETRIDSIAAPVLQYGTAFTIPRGTSTAVFPLDVPAVEILGAINTLYGSDWIITNLDSGQIAGNPPKNRHFITPNTAADGNGSILTNLQVSAKFVSVDSNSVTIQFVNKTVGNAYLANNGDQIPFMQILGFGVRASDAYTTVRDTNSVTVRGERGLESQMNWIDDRRVAGDIASLLVSQLSQPRSEVTLTVVGDPRRKPGQLITIVDAEGTRAAGTWRILSVKHNIDGPQYTQELKAVQQLPVATWGGPNGWGIGVWGS